MQIIYNIVGGLIVAAMTLALRWIYDKLNARNFKQFFYDGYGEKFHVIYNSLESPEGASFSKPKPKVWRSRCFGGINLNNINSCAETRAVGHLVYAFGKNVKTAPNIKSDIDVDSDMDLSFISFGSVTNCKTLDLLDDESNVFLDFDDRNIVAKASKLPIITFGAESGCDYGLIMKIHPKNNAERTWICCGGFGIWGTSGAAWYLAHQWRKIRKLAKNKQFACITKTRFGSDNSTVIKHMFLNSDEIERIAKEITRNGSSKDKGVETKTTTNITTKTITMTSTAVPSQENEAEAGNK